MLRLAGDNDCPVVTPFPPNRCGTSAGTLPGQTGVVRQGDSLRFDRRHEARTRSEGWVQLICGDPFHVLLGGAMRIFDVSPSGIGLVADHRLTPGEVVEVRLAPFKVRGRVGTVVRCEEVRPESETYRLVYTDRNSDTGGQEASPTTPTGRYRVAVVFAQAKAA